MASPSIVNNGDNVYQNDVVQTGSGSTLGLVLDRRHHVQPDRQCAVDAERPDLRRQQHIELIAVHPGAGRGQLRRRPGRQDRRHEGRNAGRHHGHSRHRGDSRHASAIDGTVSISVVDQHDGQVHAVQVFNTSGILIGTVTSNGTSLTLTPDGQLQGDRTGEQQDSRSGRAGIQCLPGAAEHLRRSASSCFRICRSIRRIPIRPATQMQLQAPRNCERQYSHRPARYADDHVHCIGGQQCNRRRNRPAWSYRFKQPAPPHRQARDLIHHACG